MKTKLLFLLFALIATFPTFGQEERAKKIAILQTVDTEQAFGRGEMQMIANRIADVLRSAGYRVYDRVDISAIIDEQKFQRSGLVSDDQIKKIGEMAGVDLVLFTEISKTSDGRIYIYGKVMDVETAEWKLFGDVMVNSIGEIEEALRTMIRRMLDADNGQAGNYPNNSSPIRGSGGGRDFVEDAAGVNMKMVWVEGGEFLMGGTSEQGSDASSDEQVIRRVRLDSYYICECEVTQSQWEKVMLTSIHQQASKAGYSANKGVGPDYPMYYVSWEEAQAFCAELSRLTGRTYCLPTEAQWEYAARGGKKAEGTKYSGSYSVDAVAWYDSNSGSSTHPVKNKRPNGLGLYDMSGNVYEWCSDWYGDTYNVNDTNNPTGPSTGSNRVLRGGSWFNFARFCRVSNRSYSTPGIRNLSSGFRVALIP